MCKQLYLQVPQELCLVELHDADLAKAVRVDHGDEGGAADLFLVDLRDHLNHGSKYKKKREESVRRSSALRMAQHLMVPDTGRDCF